MKCKLWIEYWATLTLLLGRYIWTVWLYVFKIDWFLYLSNSETVTVATFEIRLTPLVSMVLPILAKFVACVVHISSMTHMLTPSCSQKENTIEYKWFCHMSNMKGRQSSITHITMAAGSLSPALDERAAMKKSDLSVLTRPEMNEALAVWSSATMTCLLSFTAPGASYFLPFALLQWRYAFIKGKRSKSSLVPKLKVGMPQLIRLNTFVLQRAG